LFSAPEIGGVRTFLADARDAGLSVYASPWQLPEPERWAQAERALKSEAPRLAFLYCAELDAILHREGNGGAEAQAAILRIAARIDRARHLMARDGAEVLTLVVGDHGMADIQATVDPRRLLERAGTSRLFVDSTMLRCWGTESELSQVKKEIEAACWPGTWMDQAALRDSEVPTRDSPYGDAFFVLEEGVMFAPSFLGGAARGMHGYGLSSSSCFAALASDHPLPKRCKSLADLAPLVRSTLGLEQTAAAGAKA
jgi:hypothetical protein